MQPADDASMERVGTIIAAARRERGLTVEDVSEQTRIRATLVRQIEQSDFSACGGSVYARGHIRSIARVLGIDPGPLIVAYDREHPPAPAPETVSPLDSDPILRRGRRLSGGFGWKPAMIGSLAAVCLVAIIAIIVPESDSGRDGVAGAGAVATATPGALPPAGRPPAATPSAPAPPTSMNVRVEAREAASWLEVRDDRKQVLVQQLLQRGQGRTVVTERSLSIKMGNAGAVGLSCNGREMGVPGGRGAVVTVTLTLAASGDCTTGADARQAGGIAAAAAPAPAPR
jgi:cytoskeletal protein RodZ